VVTAAFWDKGWVHEWMPNFIAEWSGLLLVVLVVDRMTERHHARLTMPLRYRAGDVLKEIVRSLVRLTSGDMGSKEIHFGAADMPEFIAEWYERVATPGRAPHRQAHGSEWLLEVQRRFELASETTTRVRDSYLNVLQPNEIYALEELAAQFAKAAGAAAHSAEVVSTHGDTEPSGEYILVLPIHLSGFRYLPLLYDLASRLYGEQIILV
jgi:hypothetical protein